jgi:hypothetical protein
VLVGFAIDFHKRGEFSGSENRHLLWKGQQKRDRLDTTLRNMGQVSVTLPRALLPMACENMGQLCRWVACVTIVRGSCSRVLLSSLVFQVCGAE